MTSYVLVPGAGGSGWYWHRVVAELAGRGDQAVAVDLPGADPNAGLAEYRDRIVAGARSLGGPVVLVAQSWGAFSAPLACEHVPVERLVLVNAMIPRGGETAGEWWDAVAGKRLRRPARSEADARRRMSETSTPCSSTTCRQSLSRSCERTQRPPQRARRSSPSHGPLTTGRISPPQCCPAERTGYSRSSCNGGSRVSVLDSTCKSLRAGICSRSASPPPWQTA